MILTFKELNINTASYNGIPFNMARALIINQACDYVMAKVVKDTSVDEFDTIPWPEDAEVCLTMQTVNMFVNMQSVLIH
jgi:hypothetical protein